MDRRGRERIRFSNHGAGREQGFPVAFILPDLINETLTPSLRLVETALLLFIFTVVFAILFVERRNPTVALAGVAVLLLFPHANYVIYLLKGRHIYSEQPFRMKGRADQRVRARVPRQARALEERRVEFPNPSVEPFRPVVRLLLEEDRAVIWTHSQVEYEDRGAAHFEAMLEAIRGPRHFIHVVCYIIQNNELGRAFERDLEHGTELTFERYAARGRIIRG